MENNEDIKIVEDYLLGKKMQYQSGYTYFREFKAIENLLSRVKTAERTIDEIKNYSNQLKTYTEYEKKHCKLSRELIRIKQGLTIEYRMHRVAHNILAIIEKNGQERR